MRRYYYEDARWPWRADSFLRRFLEKKPPRHREHRVEKGRALDVGMGYGRNALWLAEQGYAVEGWESDRRYLREARREARRRRVELTCRQVDFARARFRGPYEVIVISNVLHQVRRSHALRVLRRARAALAPAGRLFLLVKLTSDRHFRRLRADPDWERVRGERNTFRSRRRGWMLSALEPGEVRAALRGLRIRHWREATLRSEWEEPERACPELAEGVTHRVAEVVAEKSGRE
ncbi:MAG: class I SAM-dependent methyltransferase [Terriglobia bacterium]